MVAAGLVGGFAATAGSPKPEADAKKAEAELQAVKSEIERVTREVNASQVERDRLTRDLIEAPPRGSQLGGKELIIRVAVGEIASVIRHALIG